jgi:hypothetical protein
MQLIKGGESSMDITKEIIADNFETIRAIVVLAMAEILIGVWVYRQLEHDEAIQKKVALFVDDYILELFVNIPIPGLQNKICSYRLGEKDIEFMSKKGYNIFNGERFVKGIK